MSNTGKPPVQERAQATRESLLAAATTVFASTGYEAASTRNIEEAAGVKRGLIRYHFGNKETLWKTAAQWMFERTNSALDLTSQQAVDLSPVAELRLYVRAFVQFSAHHPEVNRLMIREGMDDDWRMEWISDTFVRPWYLQLQLLFQQAKDLGAVPAIEFVNFYYILTGAGSLMFSMAPEARRVAGIDTTDEKIINAHADALANLLFPENLENR